jgi:hypothetical protein
VHAIFNPRQRLNISIVTLSSGSHFRKAQFRHPNSVASKRGMASHVSNRCRIESYPVIPSPTKMPEHLNFGKLCLSVRKARLYGPRLGIPKHWLHSTSVQKMTCRRSVSTRTWQVVVLPSSKRPSRANSSKDRRKRCDCRTSKLVQWLYMGDINDGLKTAGDRGIETHLLACAKLWTLADDV